jgi:hypothetical protein
MAKRKESGQLNEIELLDESWLSTAATTRSGRIVRNPDTPHFYDYFRFGGDST